MCLDVPSYYVVRVEYIPDSITDIMETDRLFYDVVDKFKEYDLNGGGSGFGFGIRDIDWAIENEDIANKIADEIENLAENEELTDLEIEVTVFERDNYECYLDGGCPDCYFSNGDNNETACSS